MNMKKNLMKKIRFAINNFKKTSYSSVPNCREWGMYGLLKFV